MGMRLAAETSAARARRAPLARRRARRRHDAAGQAALEGRSRRTRRPRRPTPGRRRDRLGDERKDDDERDARADPRRPPPARLEQLGREPRLGRRLHPPLRSRRRARPARGRRVRAARGDAPRAARGSSRSATSSATSSTATASSSTSPSAGATAVAELPPSATLVVNADDPLVAQLAERPDGSAPLRRRRSAARASGAPARGRLEVLRPLRGAVRLRGRLRRPPRRLPLPGLRPRAAAARRRRPDDRAATGSTARRSTSSPRPAPSGVRLPLPGLYNVYNALAAATTALALETPLDEIRAGLEAFTAAFGRFERIEAGDRTILMLLIKNPAGANEAIRTLEEGGVPETLVIAPQRPHRRRPRRVVDLGRRLRAAARCGRAHRRHGRARGRARAPLHLRRLRRVAARGDPRRSRAALDRGLALVPPGGALAVLPTYTAMLDLRAIAVERGLVRPYWEGAR